MARPDDIARFCKILSVPTRVRIVQFLRGRALCVGALSDRLDVTQGAVSQHLRIMRDAGLLVSERRGCFIHYRLNPPWMGKCRGALDRLLQAPMRPSAKKKAKCTRQGDKPCPKRKTNARSRTN